MKNIRLNTPEKKPKRSERQMKELLERIELSKQHRKEQEINGGCKDPECKYCKSTNVVGISRVVGYFSIIENWNKSKKVELKARQEGNYWDSNKKEFEETNIQKIVTERKENEKKPEGS